MKRVVRRSRHKSCGTHPGFARFPACLSSAASEALTYPPTSLRNPSTYTLLEWGAWGVTLRILSEDLSIAWGVRGPVRGVSGEPHHPSPCLFVPLPRPSTSCPRDRGLHARLGVVVPQPAGRPTRRQLGGCRCIQFRRRETDDVRPGWHDHNVGRADLREMLCFVQQGNAPRRDGQSVWHHRREFPYL